MSQQPGLGQQNLLEIVAIGEAGLRLDCRNIEQEHLEIELPDFVVLAPREYTEPKHVGDNIEVMLYLNSDENLIATTATPNIQVGQCAFLKVVSSSQYGDFLDWGLPKDLLLPHSEQAYPVRVGKSYVVYAYLDNSSGRVACSTQLHFHLQEEANTWLRKGQQVDLLIASKSDLGFKAVINGHSLGLIFHQELSQPLAFGERMKGWIKNIREDGRIDLSINTLDSESRDELSQAVLDKIKQGGGKLALSDKSSPEEIYREFKVSKKNFKRAISGLYKQRAIRIEPDYIELIES